MNEAAFLENHFKTILNFNYEKVINPGIIYPPYMLRYQIFY